MIRVEAGMSTARFCQLIDMPERTWRRWQAKARAGQQAKGPWPQPARDQARELILTHAKKHSAWGHRKIWAMVRHDGHADPLFVLQSPSSLPIMAMRCTIDRQWRHRDAVSAFNVASRPADSQAARFG